jgi:hypothetical protein
VNQALFERLRPATQQAIHRDLLGQLCDSMREVSRQKYELLYARYKLQSVLSAVAESKRTGSVRSMWGSW